MHWWQKVLLLVVTTLYWCGWEGEDSVCAAAPIHFLSKWVLPALPFCSRPSSPLPSGLLVYEDNKHCMLCPQCSFQRHLSLKCLALCCLALQCASVLAAASGLPRGRRAQQKQRYKQHGLYCCSTDIYKQHGRQQQHSTQGCTAASAASQDCTEATFPELHRTPCVTTCKTQNAQKCVCRVCSATHH